MSDPKGTTINADAATGPAASAGQATGPWSFDATCFDSRIAIQGGLTAYGRPYTVAWVNRPGSAFAGQDYANARLIAAAPEMLEALIDAYRFISQPQRMETPAGGPKTATYRVENYNALTAKLRAAIAKTTGAA